MAGVIRQHAKKTDRIQMREQLFTTLGFYRPSFFKMQVNRTENLDDINQLSDITSAVYLHEYVHFIQDISTTFGLMNISTVVDYIKYVNQSSINGSSRTFRVPVNPRPSPNDEVYFNKNLNKKYIGSVDDIASAAITGVNKTISSVTLKTGNQNIDTVTIDYTDKAGKLHYHQFGSHCIIESMAYLVENSIYPNLIPSAPDFPYRSAEKVVDFEYPVLFNDPLNILALCDISLMSFNPGDFFYSMLLEMKSAKYIPGTPEDIYRFCTTRVSFKYNGVTTLNQLFQMTSNIGSRQLCDYFTTNNFGDNKTWISYTISSAANIRIKDPYFILNIARGGKLQSNSSFANVWKKLGTPMVTNQNDQGTFYSPLQSNHNILPEYLWAISQIYGIYTKPSAQNTNKCELKDWCRKSCVSQNINNFTDTNCYASPWLRVTYPNLCSFAVMWKTWGMENETPI
ncbi:hypothetical protein [Flavobacterium anhuiense]|uniref:hypothetical protein n=1 Tax=Flavobacterium anhuiense TaxID=459526 RepID=UPI001182D1FF|nr:hypothetical protein [Flavobacterium anhuiense]